MLKTILLVEDTPRIITLHSLRQSCRTLQRCKHEADIALQIGHADAIVLHTTADRLAEWQAAVAGMRQLPVFWLCTEPHAPARAFEWGYALDGILFASMTQTETVYALKWGIRCFAQRKRWAEEREQLMLRLEERKWIDQAKAVLCDVKGITEAEAYDHLRKQAMNERKRIGDIAASIAKVYQLIHG